ncbi:MAG: colanic acid biosynthesis acetyltransferase WcaF [Lewinellaceae bacterium]|nr:colanic acid biosynthesis acetyltransferase WcaF [Lewinellaceae bacterium]
MQTDLSSFSNPDFRRGASGLKEIAWYLVSSLFFRHSLALGKFPGFKAWLLRRFGAKVGKAVVIKPSVQIKFPWKLTIGDHSWIGEHVWIDNLAPVTIGSNVCLSQGALLLTGNHDYKKPSFDLITQPIVLEDGVWIGARSVVCPGVTARSHAVLAVGSVATKELEAYQVYQGVPAEKVRQRVILKGS